MGMIRALKRLQAKYWWPTMWDDVCNWVKTCKVCQEMKINPTSHSPLQSIPVGRLFDQIAMDLLELPLTVQNHRYAVVCTEYLSKCVITKSLRDIRADTIAQFFLHQVIMIHGAPSRLLTDQGAQLISELI